MTGPDLAVLAKERGLNPYFLAYMLATGAETVHAALERDGSGALFLAWNTARWRETKARMGTPQKMPGNHEGHLETLAAAIPAGVDASALAPSDRPGFLLAAGPHSGYNAGV